MKIGFNMFLWTGHVTEEHQPIMAALKKQGYDGVQIPVLEGDSSHYSGLKKMIRSMPILKKNMLPIVLDRRPSGSVMFIFPKMTEALPAKDILTGPQYFAN